MKVSLNTVKQFIDYELPPIDELVARINSQLGGVEEVIDLNAKYKDVKIVKVVECEKHPNADKLNVCKIDAGTDELIQVVCGAPNVRTGMWAAWLPPESTVPATYDDSEPFVLGARELRGIMSNGMLASAKELGIGDDHNGIVDINADEWRSNQTELAPGESFAKVFGLDDYVIDIENKMFTHRPDLFGQIGVAREIAGIFGKQFEEKDWYWRLPEFVQAAGLELETFNDTPENVKRLIFVAMKNIEVKPSPLWLQCALVAMGGKPINNIVDVTNYVMLLTAQPTHAYDYDKLRGHKIGARMAKAGEKLQLLNGKTYELTTDDIVIADGEGPISLGGVMGGGNSEVSPETKNIVLEVATFDMYVVRKSSMRHGVFTDALARFNKGQSPLQNDRIINLLMMSIKDVSESSEQASDARDSLYDGLKSAYSERSLSGTMKVEPSFINDRLGLKLESGEIEQLLRNVRFACYVDREKNETAINVTAPFWRTDIEQSEDVVEEIGRLYGFDKLPRELPNRSTKPAPKNALRELKQAIRDSLSCAGANEVLTYSFVNEKLLVNAGQDSAHAYKLSNALSPDLQYYRTSLVPSILAHIHTNIRAGYDSFALFEIGKTHFMGEMDVNELNVPNEESHVALVIASTDKDAPNSAAYYHAKAMLSEVTDISTVTLLPLNSFDASTDIKGAQLTAAYDPNRSAVVVVQGKICGVVGEFTASVARIFKLPKFCAGFEINLADVHKKAITYNQLSRFPSTAQDISLRVDHGTPYADVYSAAKCAIKPQHGRDVTLTLLDIYQADNSDKKTITLRVKATDHTQTLTDSDVSQVIDDIAAAAEKLGAVRL